MAYKYPQWFAYEEGDFVFILPEFRKAFVKKVLQFDTQNKQQTVLLESGEKEYTYDTKDLELIRSVR